MSDESLHWDNLTGNIGSREVHWLCSTACILHSQQHLYAAILELIQATKRTQGRFYFFAILSSCLGWHMGRKPSHMCLLFPLLRRSSIEKERKINKKDNGHKRSSSQSRDRDIRDHWSMDERGKCFLFFFKPKQGHLSCRKGEYQSGV